MKSRIKWMTLALVLSLSFGLKAQDAQLGVKGGLNYSMFTDTDPASTGLGFHFGGLADLAFSDQFNLQVELLVSARAIQSKSTYEVLGVTTTSKLKTTPIYFTIPVLYKYKTSGALSFFGGPQVNFLMWNKVKSEVKLGDNDPSVGSVSGSDAKNGLNEFTFGIAAGATYDLNDNLGLGLRFIRDLRTTSDNDNATSFYNGIQLSVGYTF